MKHQSVSIFSPLFSSLFFFMHRASSGIKGGFSFLSFHAFEKKKKSSFDIKKRSVFLFPRAKVFMVCFFLFFFFSLSRVGYAQKDIGSLHPLTNPFIKREKKRKKEKRKKRKKKKKRACHILNKPSYLPSKQRRRFPFVKKRKQKQTRVFPFTIIVFCPEQGGSGSCSLAKCNHIQELSHVILKGTREQ